MKRSDIPEELRQAWDELPEEEFRQLVRTWALVKQAREADPHPDAVDEGEARLLAAIDEDIADDRRARSDATDDEASRRPWKEAAFVPETPGTRLPRRRDPFERWSKIAAFAVVVIAAAAVLYFALGRQESPTSTSAREFMLLLHGEPLLRYPQEEHARIIGEYVAWAGQLGEDGRFIAGDELAPQGRILTVSADSVRERPIDHVEEAVSGYFIIKAADLDEASRIAADCPHLRYDGAVEVRQIGSN